LIWCVYSFVKYNTNDDGIITTIISCTRTERHRRMYWLCFIVIIMYNIYIGTYCIIVRDLCPIFGFARSARKRGERIETNRSRRRPRNNDDLSANNSSSRPGKKCSLICSRDFLFVFLQWSEGIPRVYNNIYYIGGGLLFKI